jgi:cytochrome c peroxidase
LNCLKNTQGVLLFVGLLWLGTLIHCTPQGQQAVPDITANSESYRLDLPPGFPEPAIPDDNKLTTKRVALGKALFFDPILSIDSSVSCGSCHFQHLAFSDSVSISTGVHGKTGNRNAPGLINLAYNTSFFWDGGVPTLEMQVLAPIETEEEMHLSLVEAVSRLKQHPTYPRLIKEAYQRNVDVFSITRSIAAFERTLISGNSKYDHYAFQNKKEVLNEEEQSGMNLFFGTRLQCTQCHSGFNFTNNGIVSNGLFRDGDNDPGRQRITLRTEDQGKYKVPTLRNVELTAPYMHDGRFETLQEVIAHYAKGGHAHPNKSEFIQGFEINDIEINQLIAFLHTLTDDEFVKNNAFKP